MTTQKQLWTLIVDINELVPNSEVIIDGDEFHYLYNVLRLKVGDTVEITNCQGTKAAAHIQHLTKKEARILLANTFLQSQISPKICVYLALPKPSTLEEVVVSVSEMGLDELHIFRSEKCASKAPVKFEKLYRMSCEAVRISKSAFATKIFSYENMCDLFSKQKIEYENSLNLFCDESNVYDGKVTNDFLQVLLSRFEKGKNINIIIGPEASFSESEREFIFENLNCVSVSLGENILRVPNAVASALSIALRVRSIKRE